LNVKTVPKFVLNKILFNSKSNNETNHDLKTFLYNLILNQTKSSVFLKNIGGKNIGGIPKEIMEYFNMEACRSKIFFFIK
jgi:hypothetical protein